LEADAGPARRTEQDAKAPEKKPFCKIFAPLVYRKAGIFTAKPADDSSAVNVHGWMPALWVELGMLFLNLAVWLEAAARLAGWAHAV